MDASEDADESLTPTPEEVPLSSAAFCLVGTRTVQPGDFNSDVATKVVGIVVAVVSVLATGPMAAPVVTLLAIAALFIPDFFPNSIFGDLTKDILGIVYPAIAASHLTAAIHEANAALEANNQIFDSITSDFNVWLDTTDIVKRQVAEQALHSAFYDLRRNFLASMTRDFTRADFAGSLVPQYVISASRYLTILISYYKHAEKLNLHLSPSSETVQSLILQLFRSELAKITNTALNSYRSGLQQIINSPSTYPRSWDDYTSYRNIVTVTGLDLLANLQCIDPVLYPHGYHATNLNRKLVSLLNTDSRAGALSRRSNILETERKLNSLAPVMSLIEMKLLGNQYLNRGLLYFGLHYSQCNKQTVDGFQGNYSQVATGVPLPDGQPLAEYNLRFQNNCFAFRGRHWNGDVKNIYPLTLRTITQASFYFHPPEKENDIFQQNYYFGVPSNPPLQSEFVQAIPSNILSYQLGSVRPFTDRLANFEIIVESEAHTHSYLISWHHHTALQPMRLANNHAVTLEKSCVEQFHAIKAATSIKNDSNRVRIIAGPGFTGGDLVELRGGGNVTFSLTRTPDNWFAGRYKVRLWYVPPLGLGAYTIVSFSVLSDAIHAPSQVNTEIFGQTPAPNLEKLQYEDLQSIEFPNQVLIVATMQRVEIVLRNLSDILPVVIDRIELIFDRPASDPIDVASSDSRSQINGKQPLLPPVVGGGNYPKNTKLKLNPSSRPHTCERRT